MAENLLLCTETKSVCFDDVDNNNNNDQMIQENNKVLNFDLLPSLSDETFGYMVEKEIDFLPKNDYLNRLRCGDLDLNVRRDALNWIWKAHVHYGFGELSFCLSINYLDRFLSLYELPRGKTWTIQLLAVACLSLAAKMEEINVPLTIDLQVGEPKFLFEGKTIQRMELLVLSTLKWKMLAYTPCTFIDYFIRKMSPDEFPSRQLISKSMQLIISTLKGIDFLEFKPSEIAAAVAMSVSGEKRPQAKDIDKEMPCFFIQVEKDRVMKCLELIQDLTLVSGTSATTTATVAGATVPQSPNGVLEAAACLSYKSSEGTVGSCPSSSHSSPDTKRRKPDTT